MWGNPWSRRRNPQSWSFHLHRDQDRRRWCHCHPVNRILYHQSNMIRLGSQRSELFQNVFTRGNTSSLYNTKKSNSSYYSPFLLEKVLKYKENPIIFYNINILMLCNLYHPWKLKLRGLPNCTVWNGIKFEWLRENRTKVTVRSKS